MGEARSVKPFKVITMSTLEAAEQLLAAMTRAEKAQLLQWVARDLGNAFPGIDSTPGVCGGEPCIVRTRIPVWMLVRARQLGTNEADLLRSYPTLRAEDLANAWARRWAECVCWAKQGGLRPQPRGINGAVERRVGRGTVEVRELRVERRGRKTE
jgi:uncharacterized protein (DUF433 family)